MSYLDDHIQATQWTLDDAGPSGHITIAWASLNDDLKLLRRLRDALQEIADGVPSCADIDYLDDFIDELQSAARAALEKTL